MSADPDDFEIFVAGCYAAMCRHDDETRLAERERILLKLEAHIQLALTAPFSGPCELRQLEGFIDRIRKGEP